MRRNAQVRRRRISLTVATIAAAVSGYVTSATPAAADPLGVPPSGVGGRVVAWGSDIAGNTDVPTSLTGKTVTAIAAGGNNLALTSDGRVTAWGYDQFGQSDVPTSLTGKTVVAIANGVAHCLALTSDGKVTAWGNNVDHQLEVPMSLNDKQVTAIAAGGFHSLALTSDGTVTGWGNDYYGQADPPRRWPERPSRRSPPAAFTVWR